MKGKLVFDTFPSENKGFANFGGRMKRKAPTFKAGPFVVGHPLSSVDLKLMKYAFHQALDKS